MTIYIKDRATSDAVRKLAEIRGTSLTEAIRVAVEAQLAADRVERDKTRQDKLREVQEAFAAMPGSGLKADKDFYDSLSED